MHFGMSIRDGTNASNTIAPETGATGPQQTGPFNFFTE
jgi:hypothetical protein